MRRAPLAPGHRLLYVCVHDPGSPRMPLAAAMFMVPLLAARPAATHASVITNAATVAAHHAVYDLSLKSSLDQGVLAAKGQMSFDITDACTGLTTAQHLSINLTDRDGRDVTMISNYATFETRDGTKLEFHTRQITGSAITEALDGTAELDRSGGRGHADYTSPEHKRVTLP